MFLILIVNDFNYLCYVMCNYRAKMEWYYDKNIIDTDSFNFDW